MLPLYESPEEFLQQRAGRPLPDQGVMTAVAEIVARVRQEGDAALKELTRKFDRVSPQSLRVPEEAMESAQAHLEDGARNILLEAIDNVGHFHRKQTPRPWYDQSLQGSHLGLRYTAIERVGAYIPGGRAGYPSTVIMTVVPAQIAGVPNIALVSPPNHEGLVNPLVLAAAGLLGVREIYAVGGAQAIAALTFGTESIPAVNKIVGPGNVFVNEAKRQVFGLVGIDALAGPTEVAILADETANPEWVLRDLFAQGEHDSEARVILVTTSGELASEVQSKAREWIDTVARGDVLKASLEKHGAVILVPSLDEGMELVNQIAPEHVQVMTPEPERLIARIRNAGAVCLGHYTPAVVGDYFAGPNHVLPTAGSARFSSPLGVLDFMKSSSLIKFSKRRLAHDGAKIARFAELEGLLNHKLSIECRYEKISRSR